MKKQDGKTCTKRGREGDTQEWPRQDKQQERVWRTKTAGKKAENSEDAE